MKEYDGFSTYSIDMVRYQFEVLDNSFVKLQKWFNDSYKIHIETYGINTGMFKYKYFYSLNYGDSSVKVGLGFNGINKSDMYKGFIEFNPNKILAIDKNKNVFKYPEALEEIQYIIRMSVECRLVRWDLAIDMPIDRGLIQLVKDNRKYSLSMHSEIDKTEYLGRRNNNGFVKLYNKTVESKLDYDLTRLEITCDADRDVVGIYEMIPKLLYVRYQCEIDFKSLSLSDKDRLLVELLRLHPDYFKKLNYRNREKFKEYVFGSDERLYFNQNCIRNLLDRVKMFEK